MGDMPIIRTGHCGPHGTFFGAACPLCAMAISGVDPRDARIAELEREVSELREEAKASRQAEQEARDAARHSRETALHAQETLATVMNGALGDVERIAELEAQRHMLAEAVMDLNGGHPGWVERALGRRK